MTRGGSKNARRTNNAEMELIKANALRFHEYYAEQLDSLITGAVVGELTYRKPTKEHCMTMKRVMDNHIIHLANTGQPMYEILDFMISLASNSRADSQDDVFNLFNIRSIAMLITQMAQVRYMIHMLDGFSDYDEKNQLVSLLQYVDQKCPKLTLQLLESCVSLIHTGVTHLLSSMTTQTTHDGRIVSGTMHPSRVFESYNWVARWTYGKYSGNMDDGPTFWMSRDIYNLSIDLTNCKTGDDNIGLCKAVRTRIMRTLEYYMCSESLHISPVVVPYLTYYGQWYISRRVMMQLRRLLTKLISSSSIMKRANEVVQQYNIAYTGITTIQMGSSSVKRERQTSVPSQMVSSNASVPVNGPYGDKAVLDVTASLDASSTVTIPHKKTLIIVDGRNMFYKPNSPATHDINITSLMAFMSGPGQATLYIMLSRYIHERFGVVLNDHEYAQFQIVMIFHNRHRGVINQAFGGVPPQSDNITYVYTPDMINDDVVALYMWLTNPGSIIMTNDNHCNYIANVPDNNMYLRTLWQEWRRLFQISGNDYIKRCYYQSSTAK